MGVSGHVFDAKSVGVPAMWKFLHAADIHLDSPPRGLLRATSAEGFRDVTRRAFENLVRLAIAERVAFVVIAGDLYDGDWRDVNTGLFLASELGRLRDAGIRVYIVYGNHDAESNLSRAVRWPDNVHLFSSEAGKAPVVLGDLGVAIHGRSYRDRDTRDNLVPGYASPVRGCFNLGLLHTALEGSEGHEPYAPTTAVELQNKGYQYWALGHVHARREVLHEPGVSVVFPGNLQGRHVREAGAKGAVLVSVEDNEVSELRFVPLDVLRFGELVVSAEGVRRYAEVGDRVEAAMRRALASDADGRTLALRVLVRGAGGAHADLLRHERAFAEQLREIAAAFGDETLLVEKVRIETSAGVARAVSLGAATEGADSADLGSLIEAAAADPALHAAIGEDLKDLVKKLPPEVKEALEPGVLRAAVEGAYAEVAAAAVPLVAARLSPGAA